MDLKLIFIFVCYFTFVTSLYCYWNTGCHYKYFSSKTPYDVVRGDIRDSLMKIKGCEPIGIWGLMRHGKTFFPGPDSGRLMMDAINFKRFIIEAHEKKNSSLCAQDVENLKNFDIEKYVIINQTYFMDEGYQDMLGMGRRIRNAFPKLLDTLELDGNGSYELRSAAEDFIRYSTKAFADGLLEKEIKLEDVIRDDNNILAPFITCPKYNKDIKNNPEIMTQINKYHKSSDYLATKDRIQRRTGINYDLSPENITAIYDLCRYTWKGFEQFSPWCALFTIDDLKVLEYIGDLSHYYLSGYGHPTNAKFAGPLMSDLFRSFESVKNGSTAKVIVNFSHTAMLDMVYTALGLFKDEFPLTGTYRVPERKWRTSFQSTFSSNIFAVLNKCVKDESADFNVVFYLNEKVFPLICEKGICSWEEFENMLESFVNSTIDFCE